MHEFKRTNIHKVAELAQVSAMTVTRTFNGSGPVAEKTRAKILKVASELGYRPNIMAQSLRSGRTNSVGLLWSLGGPHDSIGVVRNISTRLMNHGYACHVADSLSNPEIIKQCLRDFSSRKVDGIIMLCNEDMNSDKEIFSLLLEIAHVVLVSHAPLHTGFDTLVLSPNRAIREIVDHFVSTGRRKIAFMSRGDHIREHAFTTQLDFHGLACSDDSIIHVHNRQNQSKQGIGHVHLDGIKNKFGRNMPFDALITPCDESAAAIINYLEELGYKVPQDIAVTGFNNGDMAPYFKPALASVDRCNQQVADMVEEMLLNRIENPQIPPQSELLEMKFINRRSAG